jgi:3-phosphoshikimate 1-carboxyvinyltransferase
VQDQIEIHGSGKIKSGCINTYNDHRIVMAACIANLLSDQLQMPEDTSAVLKSYPGFMNDFERLLQG